MTCSIQTKMKLGKDRTKDGQVNQDECITDGPLNKMPFLLKQKEVQALLKMKVVPQKNTCPLVITSKGLLHDTGWLDINKQVHNMDNRA